MSKNLVQPERSQMTKWWRVAFWISKATRAQAHASIRSPTHTHTQNTHTHTQICNTFLFHSNHGFVIAPECYVIRALSVLLNLLCVVCALYKQAFKYAPRGCFEMVTLTSCPSYKCCLKTRRPYLCGSFYGAKLFKQDC